MGKTIDASDKKNNYTAIIDEITFKMIRVLLRNITNKKKKEKRKKKKTTTITIMTSLGEIPIEYRITFGCLVKKLYYIFLYYQNLR